MLDIMEIQSEMLVSPYMASSSLFLTLLDRTTIAEVMKPLDHLLIFWLLEALQQKKKVNSDNFAVKFCCSVFASFCFFSPFHNTFTDPTFDLTPFFPSVSVHDASSTHPHCLLAGS